MQKLIILEKKDGKRIPDSFNKAFDICGTLNVCRKVKKILKNIIDINDVNNTPYKQGKIYRIYYRKFNSIKNIHDFMYKDATFFLGRKKKKFEEIFEYYNSK